MISNINNRPSSLDASGQADATGQLRLTPEILGRIVYFAWQAFESSDEQDQPPEDLLDRLLVRLSEAPPTIQDILHVEERSDGLYLEEATRMLIGVQATDAVGRLNPMNRQPVYKIDPLEARSLLRRYERLFPDESRWVRQVLNNPKD